MGCRSAAKGGLSSPVELCGDATKFLPTQAQHSRAALNRPEPEQQKEG